MNNKFLILHTKSEKSNKSILRKQCYTRTDEQTDEDS